MRIGTATATTAIAAALVFAVAGCTQPPAPEPTPTPAFSSEDEAFAAAEATYRAYVDALNQVDLSDPATFEAVYDLTTGEANAGERRSLSRMHAEGWTVSGATAVRSIELVDLDLGATTVTLSVCSDVSDVRVVDSAGNSVVAADRPVLQSSEVTLEDKQAGGGDLRISAIEGADEVCGE